MNRELDPIHLLYSLSKRLENSTEFMAHVLAIYSKQEGLDNSQLLEALDTSPEMLARLTLCRRPRVDSPGFAEQIRLLSDFTLIDEAVLAHVIRQVDTLTELSNYLFTTSLESNETTPPSADRFLAAARDREEESVTREIEGNPSEIPEED